MGASKVVTDVMATDKAKSPRAKKVMTFDAVPPGQQPTKITPTATSGGSASTVANTQASAGIIMNCPKTPINTVMGRRNTSAKSALDKVSPIPNIISPSKGTI